MTTIKRQLKLNAERQTIASLDNYSPAFKTTQATLIETVDNKVYLKIGKTGKLNLIAKRSFESCINSTVYVGYGSAQRRFELNDN